MKYCLDKPFVFPAAHVLTDKSLRSQMRAWYAEA